MTMTDVSEIADRRAGAPTDNSLSGKQQVVLVFQGGGALGAYQAGVYQALHEAGIEPDWIIGTSIGAINAALIAGNSDGARLARLEEFWRRMRHEPAGGVPWLWPGLSDAVSYWSTLFGGIPAFFQPNPWAFLGTHIPLGGDRAAARHPRRARRLFTGQQMLAPAHGRCRARAHQRDALLRQPRRRDHGRSCDGVRRS